MDRLEAADIIPAKALALLAVTQTLTSKPLIHDESLLAHTMGYTRHSAKKAESLLKKDPVRWYVTSNDPRLEKLAMAKNSSAESRYLWLTRLANKKNVELWINWVSDNFKENLFSLSVLKTGLGLSTFSGNRNFAKNVQHVVLYELALENENSIKEKMSNLKIDFSTLYQVLSKTMNIHDSTAGGLINRFEFELDSLNEENYTGPFLDLETYKTYVRGNFYSSLYIEGLHYLDSLSSIKAAQIFLGEMENGKSLKAIAKQDIHFLTKLVAAIEILKKRIILFITSLINNIAESTSADKFFETEANPSDDFIQWYENLVLSKSAKGDTVALSKDISHLPTMGVPPLLRTLKEIKKFFKFADPSLYVVLKRLVFRMDSRINHRIKLANISYNDLLDLKLTEKYDRSAFENKSSDGEHHRFWYAYFTRDESTLKKLLHSSTLELKSKLSILYYLKFLKTLSKGATKKEYDILVKQYPRDWKLHRAYAGYLMEIKDYAGVRRLLRNWLKLDVNTGGLAPTVAINKIAESYYKEGKYQAGLKTIEPVAEGMQGGSLWIYGNLLDKTGQPEQAEKVFHSALQRYPTNIKALNDLATFFWRHNRYQDAANLIGNFPYNISDEDWQSIISKDFAEIFAEQKSDKGLAAFTALENIMRGTVSLEHFAYSIFLKKNYELAFQIHTSVRYQRLQQILHIVNTYPYLEKLKGSKAARSWLKENIPPQLMTPSAMFFFDQKQYHHLWSLVRSPDAYAWLLRASVISSFDDVSKRDRKMLENYFNIPGLEEHYGILGKYMLGKVDEKNVLKAATDNKRRCEYAFFLGFKAQSEGRYEDASDWYRVALETGLIRNGEYRWAHNKLFKWQSEGMNLSNLAQKKL